MNPSAHPGAPLQPPGGVDPRLLEERITRSLQQAQQFGGKLGKTDSALNLASILSSAAMTGLTGWTSMAGPIFGDSVAAWRLTCVIAALLGFMATLIMGLNQQLRLGDRVARANECIGRLKSLDFSLAAQTENTQELWKEYADILRRYPQVLK